MKEISSKSLTVFCRERTREDKKRDREEDEEDVYERRRLERRLRDKEAAYQEVRESSIWMLWFRLARV